MHVGNTPPFIGEGKIDGSLPTLPKIYTNRGTDRNEGVVEALANNFRRRHMSVADDL